MGQRWPFADHDGSPRIAAPGRSEPAEAGTTTVDVLCELYCRYLPDTTLLDVNHSYAQLFDLTRHQIVGRKWIEFLPVEQRDGATDAIARLTPADPRRRHTHPVVLPSGEERWQEWIDHAVFAIDRSIVEVHGVGRDVTERHRLEARLRKSEERWRWLFAISPDGIVLHRRGVILEANDRAAELLGAADGASLVGSSLVSVVSDGYRDGFVDRMRSWIEAGRRGLVGSRLEVAIRRLDGEPRSMEVSVALVDLDDGPAFLAAFRDVTEQRREMRDLERRADHDPLTGLANRAMMERELHRMGHGGTVILLDLDRFKTINDRHGHEAGDFVLTAVAERLRRLVRAGDLVARLGGDEFAVLLSGVAGAVEPRGIAQRIVASVTEPIPFRERILEVGASVGMTTRDAAEPNDTMRRADAALYAAKAAGGGCWREAVVGEAAPGTVLA